MHPYRRSVQRHGKNKDRSAGKHPALAAPYGPKPGERMEPKDMVELVVGGTPAAIRLWAEVCADAQRDEEAWVASLRAEGVKAAHPDDGWVDRKTNTLQFMYPQFDDGVQVGDVVALGWHNRYRLVKLTAYRPSRFAGGYWSFEPVEVHAGQEGACERS